MTIVAGLLFFSVAVWFVIIIARSESTMKNIFWSALLVKALAGICLGLLYSFHYKVGDTLLFFSDAVKLSDLAKDQFGAYLNFLARSEFPDGISMNLIFDDQRALLMVKITSLFCLLSFDNYWLITIYMTLISFLGSWYLVRQIHSAFPEATGSAMLAFLFFPSVVFWTSGVIKESLAMASLYFICGVFIRVWTKKHVKLVIWLVTIIAVYLLWSLKYYFAGIFLAVVSTSLLYRFVGLRLTYLTNGSRRHLAWFLIFATMIAGVTLLHPNFNVSKLFNVMVQNYETFQVVSRPEAVIEFKNLQPTFFSILTNSPEALFAGLYRPLFFDSTNALSLLLSMENLVLLILTVVAMRYLAQAFRSNVSILLVAIIVYVILLAIFITLSTPNFGTLARYRVGYLPFFVFLILLAPPLATRLLKTFSKIANAGVNR